MPAPIDFYFDYSSPYGYFAAMKIDALAARHGRDVSVETHPARRGVQGNGRAAVAEPAAERRICTARHRAFGTLSRHCLPPSVEIPDCKPGAGARILLDARTRSALAKKLAQSLYHAFFVEDRDISSPAVTADVAATLGLKRDEVLAALNDAAVKDKLKNEVDAAIRLGVFGSPYIVIDGEAFWGIDRFDQIERWLARGPF